MNNNNMASSLLTMFGIIQGQAIALSGIRNQMVIGNYFLIKETVLHLYSALLVKQLLNDSKVGQIFLQIRKGTCTMQFGNSVLEFGYPCPPYCSE